MEIERRAKKETSWIIRRKEQPGLFVLKSEEETGVGASYAIHMRQGDTELRFGMGREEFLNFISILNGFKDVVLSSEMRDETPADPATDAVTNVKPSIPTATSAPAPAPPPADKKAGDGELDPTEWDPF